MHVRNRPNRCFSSPSLTAFPPCIASSLISLPPLSSPPSLLSHLPSCSLLSFTPLSSPCLLSPLLHSSLISLPPLSSPLTPLPSPLTLLPSPSLLSHLPSLFSHLLSLFSHLPSLFSHLLHSSHTPHLSPYRPSGSRKDAFARYDGVTEETFASAMGTAGYDFVFVKVGPRKRGKRCISSV